MFLKIVFFAVYVFKPNSFFLGGNDADYYDSYARGTNYPTSSIWPDFLRLLNELGVYSREGVSFFLMILGVVAIPLLVGRLSMVRGPVLNGRVCLMMVIVVSFYPTLFYYTLDIYRDVLMLFLFLVGLVWVKSFIGASSFHGSLGSGLMVLLVGGVLFLFRGYLGFAFIFSFLVFRLVRFSRFSVLGYVVPLLIILNLLFAVGFLKPLLSYRNLFNDVQSATNLGIQFDSVYKFIPDLMNSLFSQLFGFFYPNLSAVIAFVLESVPFCFAFVYLVRNRKFSTSFVDYVVVFSVVYSTVWVLGNDNLGTAMRLRMYSYVGVLIACAIIYQRKSFFLKFLAGKAVLAKGI
ncbi:hypothetical protein V0R50_26205 [Pseudomonas sp. 148P]|uniref:Glycosyltransferase RgtA/B/C/D-like domain-containing protein n=1 Tax=Pseudomonas ulcerans TaxID=3115852 RepID=A0ABU7HYT3_9PSED|nr:MULTISPECIES: hypothetical protein [unclassified Pseudomonas]MEE1922830.1 hypothetical protein [Pseudomonas sp. 147P]MEE1936730.1 hypothetical protein [Pseudomonas sp. 148P]